MTDEARIKELTALARRAFPDVADGLYDPEHGRMGSVAPSQDAEGGWHVLVMMGDASHMLVTISKHPKALDALEAALLVLTGTRIHVMVPPTRGYIPWHRQDEVTDDMVDRVADVLSTFRHPTGKRAIRNALEAVLRDEPE